MPRCSPRKGKVSYGQKKDLPDSAFALVYKVRNRKYRKYLLTDKEGRPSRSHANNCVARASQKASMVSFRQAARALGLTPTQVRDRVIRKCQKVQGSCPLRNPKKLKLVSKDRYRASAVERRRYGGKTVTEFWVVDPDTGKTLFVVTGYGTTPGERKTFARKAAEAKLREQNAPREVHREFAHKDLETAREELQGARDYMASGFRQEALDESVHGYGAAQRAAIEAGHARAPKLEAEALRLKEAAKHSIESTCQPATANPVDVLPVKGQELWERVYQDSLVQYGGDEEVAARVAWTVVKTKYKPGPGRKWKKRTDNPCLPCLAAFNPRKRKTPDPGRMILLGDMLELHTVNREGLVVYTFGKGECKLLWSERQKALYGVPGLKLKNRSLRANEKETARLFYRWADRPAEGAAMVSIPNPVIRDDGKGIAVVYRSDKWGPKGGPTTDYIHFFGDGVHAGRGPGNPPRIFFVQGGDLRVTPEGIAG